jgi:preprotein translocase subunit YajC
LDYQLFAFQAVPPAPGRAQSGDPGVAAPAPLASPEAEGGGGPPPDAGFAGMLPILILIPLLIFLFWSSRSQQKKQEATIAALKKGDRVLSQSGLVGRLLEVDKRYAKVELAPGVKVTMLRSSLAGRDTEDSSGKKAEPSADETKK